MNQGGEFHKDEEHTVPGAIRTRTRPGPRSSTDPPPAPLLQTRRRPRPGEAELRPWAPWASWASRTPAPPAPGPRVRKGVRVDGKGAPGPAEGTVNRPHWASSFRADLIRDT